MVRSSVPVTEPLRLTREQASLLAGLARKGINTESPHYYTDFPRAAPGGRKPRELHPAFYGCYDWHSAVHSHWTLVRVLRRVPDLPEKATVRAALAEHLTAANLRAEVEFFTAPGRESFERPYGWAWLLKLAEEVHGWDDADGREWAKNLAPLRELIATRFREHLPKQTRPNRSGTHGNTAFALTFLHDYAQAVGDQELLKLAEERARTWYGNDELPAGAPFPEPGRADFFSPSLMAADLMRRVLPPKEFAAWLPRVLPGLAHGQPRALFEPVEVPDRRDLQLIHLDGLNLSRAWCQRAVAAALPPDDPARPVLRGAALRHAAASLPHIASGHFSGEHWLPSFGVYLLTAE